MENKYLNEKIIDILFLILFASVGFVCRWAWGKSMKALASLNQKESHERFDADNKPNIDRMIEIEIDVKHIKKDVQILVEDKKLREGIAKALEEKKYRTGL